MEIAALIFPHTALRRSVLGALAPLLGPLVVLEPPSLAPVEYPPALAASGLLQVLRPPVPPDAGQKARHLAGLLRRWDAWRRSGAAPGQVEALKAGVQAPPPPETARSLIKEIKSYGSRPDQPQSVPPEVVADLFLHLAHIQDQEAAELEGLLAQAQRGGEALKETMGLRQPESEPADFEADLLALGTPPLDYRLAQDHLLGQRLAAWASLARQVELPAAVLATASGQAAALLLERANRRLRSEPLVEPRSPAGAALPLAELLAAPHPAKPLAQEVARLELPDLSHLAPEALAEMGAEQAMGRARELLGQALADLRERPWTPDLAARAAALAGQAAELGRSCDTSAEAKQVSLLAFPGLSRDQVLGLMAGRESDLPLAQEWPQKWPPRSCPMLALH